jgi:hypothetical protein
MRPHSLLTKLQRTPNLNLLRDWVALTTCRTMGPHKPTHLHFSKTPIPPPSLRHVGFNLDRLVAYAERPLDRRR